MTTHISYETARKLKDFLKESAPEPMDIMYVSRTYQPFASYYAYQLHDLLSKPFCEAFVKAGKVKFGFDEDEVTDFIADWSTEIAYAFWNGGLPAVEKTLCEMMESK